MISWRRKKVDRKKSNSLIKSLVLPTVKAWCNGLDLDVIKSERSTIGIRPGKNHISEKKYYTSEKVNMLNIYTL